MLIVVSHGEASLSPCVVLTSNPRHRGMEHDPGSRSRPRVQYVYDFATLDRVPDGPTSAQGHGATAAVGAHARRPASPRPSGAVLTGSHIILTLGTQARGSGANAHTHPNEQFNYIVQGTMTGEIAGETVFAPRGTMLHTPGGIVHTGLACPEEDLVFLALKDTRHGITGPSVDGKYEGPNYLPGFGTRAGERMKSTAELIAESGRDPEGEKTRYVYDFARLENKPGPRNERRGDAAGDSGRVRCEGRAADRREAARRGAALSARRHSAPPVASQRAVHVRRRRRAARRRSPARNSRWAGTASRTSRPACRTGWRRTGGGRAGGDGAGQPLLVRCVTRNSFYRQDAKAAKKGAK